MPLIMTVDTATVRPTDKIALTMDGSEFLALTGVDASNRTAGEQFSVSQAVDFMNENSDPAVANARAEGLENSAQIYRNVPGRSQGNPQGPP